MDSRSPRFRAVDAMPGQRSRPPSRPTSSAAKPSTNHDAPQPEPAITAGQGNFVVFRATTTGTPVFAPAEFPPAELLQRANLEASSLWRSSQ